VDEAKIRWWIQVNLNPPPILLNREVTRRNAKK
jgi:hypothetical protein